MGSGAVALRIPSALEWVSGEHGNGWKRESGNVEVMEVEVVVVFVGGGGRIAPKRRPWLLAAHLCLALDALFAAERGLVALLLFLGRRMAVGGRRGRRAGRGWLRGAVAVGVGGGGGVGVGDGDGAVVVIVALHCAARRTAWPESGLQCQQLAE